jgi:hypothetical protein
MDLPDKKSAHTTDTTNGFKFTAGSNCMIFSKEMKEKGNQNLDLDILISQRFFNPNDRYEIGQDGKSRMFKKISEFVIGTLYGSRIAITNSTESEHEVQVITEIPQGSIPVTTLEYSKSTTMKLDPLSTKIVEFFFYFPGTGDFTCYPASITKDGFLVASAPGVEQLQVKTEVTKKDMTNLKDILSSGSQEDILNFMKEKDLSNYEIFQFESIYWLLKDKGFYEKVIEILRNRFIFNATVWSFSIYHGDYATFVEFLRDNFGNSKLTRFGFNLAYFQTSVYSVDSFKFKEYNPLINPRVHDIGEHKHNILNEDFKTTYSEFLSYLIDKQTLNSRDYLYLGVYLLLQDRIDEAMTIYAKIDGAELEGKQLKIQYDYLSAYLDLYADFPEFKKAREICDEYLVYPIYTWRNRFIDLANQIAEFDGEVAVEGAMTEENMKKKKNQAEAEKSEYIQTELENGQIKVTTKNVENYTISYYKIDLEIMFSQDPFLSVGIADYSFVRANMVEEKTISKTTDYETKFEEIPEEFKNSNMLIQITCGAKSQNLTYFPSSMKAYIMESYGQIKVTGEDGKPLSKVYVKCFSKKKNGGTVSFYKDGYTDLRGTFDYASLNLDGVTGIDKFALLVVSEEKGALIKQTNPPSNLAKVENKALNLKSKKMATKQMAMATKHHTSNKYWMV